jgi:hypothetical protein
MDLQRFNFHAPTAFEWLQPNDGNPSQSETTEPPHRFRRPFREVGEEVAAHATIYEWHLRVASCSIRIRFSE